MYTFTIAFDANSKRPLYEQLYEHIAGEIRERKLAEGERMPSKRGLAAHLGISVNTVETAYEILVQEGYLAAVPKSGFYVRYIDAPAAGGEFRASEEERGQAEEYRADFRTGAADIRSFPYATWVKLSKEIMYANPGLLNLGEAKGDYELRACIAKYLHEFRGVNCSPRQVIVGAGIEYLIMLLCELLGSGRRCAIENPGYEKTDLILRNGGFGVNYVPIDEKGISAEELSGTNSDTAYVTPSHQFPTGAVMPIDRRIELLKWAEKKEGRYIIEDDFSCEFNYSKRPVTALQGIYDSEKVIYLNTFSRTLAPSIRIAYMVLPKRLLADYEKRFFRYSSTVPRFEQHTLARFISENYLSRHLSRLKNTYKKRRAALTDALYASRYPVSVGGDKAGVHLTFKSPAAAEILARTREHGIKLYNMDDYYFTPRGSSSNTLIAGYAGVDTEDINYLKEVLLT